ncbi:MAG: hypothetical protein AAFR11_15085 [Pseudomonadota bacterium]
MGWICKKCGEFSNDNSIVTCPNCGNVRDGAAAAKPAANDGADFPFEPVTSGGPYKSTGLQKLVGKYTLSYGGPKDVPGTGYDDVCPCQKHVNPDIVADKVDMFAKTTDKTPSVPVFRNTNTGKLTILGDGHHTFVAALKSATPVILYLFEAKAYSSIGHSNWKSCTYEKFDVQAAAKTGTKMT